MPRGLAQKTVDLIGVCHHILTEIQPTTVRGVAYQLFNRKLIPNMYKQSTDKVSRVLTIAREADVIPWEWIVDDGRAIEKQLDWSDPDAFIAETLDSYRRDYWQAQPKRVYLVCEKGTVKGMLQPVIRRFGLPYGIYHGFGSATALKQLANLSRSDRRPLILLYAGDHDPSGRHMSDVDIPGRVAEYGGRLTVERVAIEPEQIDAYDLLTFDAAEKEGDVRYGWFVERYGTVCCELDALAANVLRDLVAERVVAHLDVPAWNLANRTEAAEARSLREFFAAWPGVRP